MQLIKILSAFLFIFRPLPEVKEGEEAAQRGLFPLGKKRVTEEELLLAVELKGSHF